MKKTGVLSLHGERNCGEKKKMLVFKSLSYFGVYKKHGTVGLTLYHTIPTFNNPEKEAY